jgi:hypothetical protein
VRVTLTLCREDVAVLSELAYAASRQPRDQAIYLLSRAIRQAARRQERRTRERAGEVRHAAAY